MIEAILETDLKLQMNTDNFRSKYSLGSAIAFHHQVWKFQTLFFVYPHFIPRSAQTPRLA